MARISGKQVDDLQAQACEIIRQNPALSYDAVGKKLGLAKRTVWQWYDRDTHGFKEKWDKALQDAFARLEGLAIQTMADLLVDGSFQAAKYVLDNRNYGATQKIKADVDSSVDINITIEE